MGHPFSNAPLRTDDLDASLGIVPRPSSQAVILVALPASDEAETTLRHAFDAAAWHAATSRGLALGG